MYGSLPANHCRASGQTDQGLGEIQQMSPLAAQHSTLGSFMLKVDRTLEAMQLADGFGL